MTAVSGAAKTTLVPKAGSVHLTFRYERISLLAKFTGEKEYLESPKLLAHGLLWWVGISSPCDNVHVRLYCDHEVCIRHTLRLDPAGVHAELKFDDQHKLKAVHKKSGYNHYIPYDTRWSDYIVNDTVTVHLDISEFLVRESFPLAQPIPSSQLLTAALYLDPTYSDLTLIVDGERLPAHKCILCLHSPVLRAMFQHPMKEAASSEVAVTHSAAAVKAMLHFCYAGTLQAEEQALAMQLLDLSVYYQMEHLQQAVVAQLLDKLTVDNVRDVLQLAMQLGSRALEGGAAKFLVDHAEETNELL